MVVWDDEILRYCDITGSDGTDRWYEEHWDVEAKELSSRFFNILNALCDMRDYCVKNKINHVLIAGDLFHKRGTIEVVVFNAIYKVLDSFYDVGIAVHLIAGNHDQVDASVIPTSSIHSFKDIAHVIEKPEYFTLDGLAEVVAIPYSKDKKFVLNSMEELREQCKDPERAILLCHVGITGGTVGSGMYSMKDEYSLKDLKSNHWKYLIAGHYHQPQLLDYNAIYIQVVQAAIAHPEGVLDKSKSFRVRIFYQHIIDQAAAGTALELMAVRVIGEFHAVFF